MNGLNKQDIDYRINNGLVNNQKDKNTKTIKKIILDNTITLFNILNIVLLVLVLTTRSFRNGLFAIIIVVNTIIAIGSELKAKRIIDKLKLATKNILTVVREGKKQEINEDEVLLDDIIYFSAGDTVLLDTIIEKGEVNADESVITGESDAIKKKKEDKLISGSVIVSGNCYAKVIAINNDNYASKLVKDASTIKTEDSYLKKNINNIIKIITIIIIPIGVLLFISQYFKSNLTYNEAILSVVAGVVGMIPEGLILLTTTALFVGVITLGKKNVIVQKLNGIEELACTDVLCLDKTGTITTGELEVIKEINLSKHNFSNIIASLTPEVYNSTDKALTSYYQGEANYHVKKHIPFTSTRKYKAIFTEEKVYALGALEYMTTQDIKKYDKEVGKYIKEGCRVLTLVEGSNIEKNNKIKDAKILGFIILKDRLRDNAQEILNYFYEQNVDIKIISGDHPDTIVNITKGLLKETKCITGPEIDADFQNLDNIVNSFNIFARVTPNQKREIIKALKKKKTVAYIGDGVNDILALKESNCGIALEGGSPATKNVSQIVLTTSDFSVLPKVIKEGRKVVNNIERVSCMYLLKTMYSILLSLLSIIFTVTYPFYPIQLTLISTVCVGIPSLFLALEPNYSKVTKGFLRKVFKNVIPNGICIFTNILVIELLCITFHFDYEFFRIVAVALTGFVTLNLLYRISKPLTFIRKVLVVGCFTTFFATLFFAPNSLLIKNVNIFNIILSLALIYVNAKYIQILYRAYDKIEEYVDKKVLNIKNWLKNYL